MGVKDDMLEAIETGVRDDLLERLTFDEAGKTSFMGRVAAMASKKLETERDKDEHTLNPQPNKTKRKQAELELRLKYLKEALEDEPLTDEEELMMQEDVQSLRDEAHMQEGDVLMSERIYKEALEAYHNLFEDTDRRYEEIEHLLDEKEFEDAEKRLEELEARKEEMRRLYLLIGNAYEQCAGALLLIAEEANRKSEVRGGSEDGDDDAGVVGMRYGEDAGEYAKRIGEERMPATLRHIDKTVESAERQWQRIAALSPEEMRTIKRNWKKTIANVLERASVGSNMFIDSLERLLAKNGDGKDGAMAATLGNADAKELLKESPLMPQNRFLENQFGIREKEGEEKSGDTAICYACLHSKLPRKGDANIGGKWGNIVVRWKPKAIAGTFFCGDSLVLCFDEVTYCKCSLLTNPSPCSFSPDNTELIASLKSAPLDVGVKGLMKASGAAYIEVQLHGMGVYGKAEAIESITFESELDIANLSASATAKISELGIKVYVEGEEMEG